MHNHYFYKDCTEEQFAADEYFQQWVLQPNAANEEFWNTFAASYPAQQGVMLRARLLVEDLSYTANGIRPLGKEEKASLKENIFMQLDLQMPAHGPAPQRSSVKRLYFLRSAAAAVFVLAAVSSWLFFRRNIATDEKGNPVLLAEHTGVSEMKRILLPDSTIVVLNANSVLRYNPGISAAANREVTLEGNAYFIVRKDPDHKPFMVHAHTMDITVLGTEFNVNARTASPEISLASGKVMLTESGQHQSPVYLLPGDRLRLDTMRHVFTRSSMDARLYAAWTDGIWNFRHNSLEEITELIREYYGVEIIFQREKSRHLRINAVIEVGSLQKLIPVLIQTLHTPMTLSDNRLVIE